MKLHHTDVPRYLLDVPRWSVVNERLTRVFEFDSYGAAVAFAVKVAIMADKTDHHPDSLDIGWKKVTVAFITHSVNALSVNDFLAAQRVDKL